MSLLQPGQFSIGNNPVPEVAAGAARYRMNNGFLNPEQDYSQSFIPMSRSREVASAYHQMPEFDEKALPAYHQMGEEVRRQYGHMTAPASKGGMGMSVDVSAGDPYDASTRTGLAEMRNDVENNHHISVLSTASTGGHPYFGNDENDMFRAVHDVFGHLGSGRGVDYAGEDAAFQKHAAMFSPLARQAMASETRGQNASLRMSGEFPVQKVGVLPDHLRAPRNLSPDQFEDVGGEIGRARSKNQEFGIT